MSYSADVRQELCRLPLEKNCCRLAELSALYQTAGSLKLLGRGQTCVQFEVSSPALARRIFVLLQKRLGLAAQLHYVTYARLGGRRRCVLTLGPKEAPAFLTALGIMEPGPDGEPVLKRTSPHAPLKRACCQKAFLRGAMLGAGSVTESERGYHLDIAAQAQSLENGVAKCLQRFGLPIKRTTRRGTPVFYLSSGDEVSAFLTLTGAHGSVMRLEDKRVQRQLMAGVQRSVNCDSHNLQRQTAAGDAQIEHIAALIQTGAFGALPPALQQIAKLRLNNPELGYEALGELLSPPVGKSGVSHRLRRLMDTPIPKNEHPQGGEPI